MKRFYKSVETGPAVGGGYSVLLDARPIRTPEQHLLVAPNQALADAIAEEWAAQGDMVLPQTMPLTQLLTTTIDRAPLRTEITQEVLKYIDGDLLCYRTNEPEALKDEQTHIWGQWLAWFKNKTGVDMNITHTLTKLEQPEAAHKATQAMIADMNDHAFTTFHLTTSITGSVILGLAFTQGDITPDAAWHCAFCEELFYERIHDLTRHGLDPIEERRRTTMLKELEACAHYLTLTKS